MPLTVQRLLISLAVLALLVAIAPVAAQSSSTPGRVEVPVDSDSDAARASAAAEGLSRVLARLTGNPDIADSAVGRRLRGEAETYLQGFAYREVSAPVDELRLLARFDVRRLREALVGAGHPIWPDRPPTVLVWAAVDDAGERRIVQAGDRGGLRMQLAEAGAALGIRLLFPIMDLEDMGAITYSDIAVGFVDPVIAASRRYGADRVLAGRLMATTADAVAGRWLLADPDAGTARRWQVRAEDTAEAIEATAAAMAAELREAFAYQPDLRARGRLALAISGIHDLATHDRVVDRLLALSGVERVNPVAVGDDRVRFELAISVEPQRVRDALARDERLRPAEDGFRWE